MKRRPTARLSLVSLVFLAAACGGSESGSGDDSGEACSGHGHLHDDACHCDDGYVPDGDDACVPESDSGTDGGAGTDGGSSTDGTDDSAGTDGGSGGGTEGDSGSDGTSGTDGDSGTDGGTDSDGEPTDACDIPGNIALDEIPETGSVGFFLFEGDYRFIKRPGMEDTSINHIDTNCEYAYGWSRDKPWDDDTAVESSWVLDLATMTFTDIPVPGARWVVLRDALDSGVAVGKLSIDNGTPDDPSDDESRGFIYDPVTGDTELFAREGYSDIGFTTINADGLVAGFNDFGTQGFTFSDSVFTDLDHDDAYRLFPFQVNSSGTVVGFWGVSEDTWYNNSENPGFYAVPSDDGMVVTRFELPGQTGTGLTGLNDAGQIAGIGYSSTTSLPVVFMAEGFEADPTFYPLAGDLEPFATGISETGLVHGQIFILAEPPVCGGHGTLDGEMCVCDAGFEQDPYDPANCLPPDAECNGHGHLHGNECHCDDGFKRDANDPTQCVPS